MVFAADRRVGSVRPVDGRFGRRTRACEDAVAEEGCDRSSFKRAEAVSRARGIDISASTIRAVYDSVRRKDAQRGLNDQKEEDMEHTVKSYPVAYFLTPNP